MRPVAASLTLAIFVSSLARNGLSCGLTPPVGPLGLPTVCHGDGLGLGMRAGLTLGGTSTRLDFGPEQATLVQAAGTGTFDLVLADRLSFSGALGASLGGRLDYRSEQFDLLPGPVLGIGAAYRLFGGRAPFVQASLTLSVARSTTRAEDESRASFTSRDYRLGLAVGKTFGSVAAPFLVARYFGAGTTWSVGGGHGADHFRYHIGLGSAFGLSSHFDALVEIAFVGERRASLGAGYTF